MILYFALSYSANSELSQAYYKDWGLKDVLVSYYPYSKKRNITITNPFNYNIFLDSGAFSAWKKKEVINIDNYCQLIHHNKKQIKIYAGLDVIGDPIKTKENIEYMESKGLSPLPTFHYKSPDAELIRLIREYDYIALGGLVPLALQQPKMQAWLDHCFSIIKDKCKIHGFGVNAFWAWKRYPFYSVDATSWLQGMQYGRVISFKNGGMISKGKSDGITNLIFHANNTHWKKRTKYILEEYQEAARFITILWEKRGIKWER